MISLLKLGVAAGVGYSIGGNLGLKVAEVSKLESENAKQGAIWAGRITTFAAVATLLNRL